MSGPTHWRVTLIWPKPPEWDQPNAHGYIPYERSSPEVFAKTMGWQLQHVKDAALEAAEMRARTVRFVATLPAQEPLTRTIHYHYEPSAQRAVTWAVDVAQFGAALVSRNHDLNAPLPEPVRIKVEALSRAGQDDGEGS